MEHYLLRPETDSSHPGSINPSWNAVDARWTKLSLAELTNAIAEHGIIGTKRVYIFSFHSGWFLASAPVDF